MTTDDEQPGPLPFDRLDFGDAEQRAEMDGIDDPPADEPVTLVDEPVRVRQPYDQTQKRRNQRPLPT
ncbi:hypothetical protein [Salinispora arenicola]|uniref:Uncharacterized protein n=2 Tax=Salinispora arenicola TaxID=168697 RepID=A0A542XJQ5_SALAC|nr:hypothetical protein [Salinispora arenicola]MCN0150813.1 hypothetical protein [Salinispora arenicola]MCN0180884.1 hypothetical protein [Salinispora arenicola]NIL41614.1 hypothetical protein [Salinispora arenicola]NIL56039.1 hypothetical protein [Salinispora arenicola]NIL60813.1 hypothetical protein [Salinispora arenicola]